MPKSSRKSRRSVANLKGKNSAPPPSRRKFLKYAGVASMAAMLTNRAAAAASKRADLTPAWLAKVKLGGRGGSLGGSCCAPSCGPCGDSGECCGSCSSSDYNDTGFVVQQQEQTEWCWDAVGLSIAQFCGYGLELSQCEVYSAIRGADCCGYSWRSLPDYDYCNNPGWVEDVFSLVGFDCYWGGGICWEDIKDGIDNYGPIIVGLDWFGCGGHYCTISGYECDGGEPVIHIQDPLFGPSSFPLCDFASGYQTGACWSAQYTTCDC